LSVAAAAAPAACFAVAAGFAAADEADRPAVDGVLNGPVSREHPAVAQPVAAGPVKVGAPVPRLVDVMVLDVWATRADAAPPERATSAIGRDNMDRITSALRTRLGIELHRCGRSPPPGGCERQTRLNPHPGVRCGRHRARAGQAGTGHLIVPIGDCSSCYHVAVISCSARVGPSTLTFTWR
jgi:hypothetical protein